ncbi:MAG: DsbA family protein [Tissierellia bacterium]|nr:DsbA family protein [Tissierellia bacterium]
MKKIELVSDFSCPFCFRQHLAFQKLKDKNISFNLVPIPHMLRAETPMDGKEFSSEDVKKYTLQLKKLESSDSLFQEVSFAPLTHTYNTYTAHILALGAYEQGKYLPFALEVYRAYFERGENIAKMEILTPILEKLELNPTQTMNMVSADTMRGSIHRGFELKKKFEFSTIPAMYIEEKNILIPQSTSEAELEKLLEIER